MKTLKIIFLLLSIILPLIFIILTIINIKNVKKSKKSKIRIITAVVLIFSINFVIYNYLNLKDNKNTITNIKDTKKDNVLTNYDIIPVNDEAEDNKVILNGSTKTGAKIETKDGVTKIDGIIIVNKDYSIKDTYIPTNTYKKVNEDTKSCATCIIREVYDAFTFMQEAAKEKDLKLWIQSGYRSYNYQKMLYENYVKKDGEEKASLYSAHAGHSEHQTGLAIDLNTVTSSFANTKEGKWVFENAYKYGFIIRYPQGKEEETGYNYEPWHLRYVGIELATILYNNGNWITLESYFGII